MGIVLENGYIIDLIQCSSYDKKSSLVYKGASAGVSGICEDRAPLTVLGTLAGLASCASDKARNRSKLSIVRVGSIFCIGVATGLGSSQQAARA